VLRSVSLLLTEQQTREFEWFFENDLLAGSRMFAARVRDMGPGHAWYAAQFAEENPLTYTPMIGWARNNDIRWKVDCKLVLYGTPRVAGPVLTSFKGVVRVPLLGRARNAGIVTLSGAAVVPLVGTAASPWAFSGAVEVGLIGAVEEPEGLPFYGRVSIPLAGLVASVQPMTLAAEISVPLVGKIGRDPLPLAATISVALAGKVELAPSALLRGVVIIPLVGAAEGNAPTPAGYKHWRIYGTGWRDYLQIGEVEFGGVQATGGTATALNQYSAGYPAANAFNGLKDAGWCSAAGWANTGWVAYEYSGAKTFSKVVLTAATTGVDYNYAPDYFKVQASDDGSTWVDIASFSDPAAWFSGESREYNW
jgi:hypothetical protein